MFRHLSLLILATGVAVWAAGCSKSDSTTKDSTKTTDDTVATDEHAGHDHAEGEGHEDEATGDSETAPAADTGGQTLCPVSGHKIDLASFAEYKEKKVYFCCDDCIKKFNEDPEKYVALLPQFGGKEDASKAEGS
jgi:YHS domain-containing protein